MSSFVAGLALGFIAGVILIANASGDLIDDHIKAGVFDRHGIAYRITPLGTPA